VLEPLCGAEPRLFEKLATFCEQAHQQYQLLFGVSSPNDPAIAVVRRLRAAYPTRDLELVVDPLRPFAPA
jgi:ceramide glucosyltransferase